MKQLYKIRPKYFFPALLTAVFLFALTWKTAAERIHSSFFYTTLTENFQDTTRPVDTLPRTRVDTFSLKLSKDSLDAPVKYEAADSAVVLIKARKILLYGKTRTDYKDISLTAPRVELD